MSKGRGCGDARVSGAIYVDVPLSKFGLPLEYFLVDPPVPVDAQQLGLTPIGVKLIEKNGIYHIMDWVGEQHYRNPSDFVEEVKRMGLSRRLATTTDFSKITAQSRIVLLHRRAFIKNFHQYPVRQCPKNIPDHVPHQLKSCCIGQWYDDLEGGETLKDGTGIFPETSPEKEVRRSFPEKDPHFVYYGHRRPENVVPEYQLAIFASFPIPRLVVVEDPIGKKHEQSVKKAIKAGVPVELVNE